MIQAIVTDIEGTTSSISFVKDVLFPYAETRLADFVRLHADDPEVNELLHASEAIVGHALSLEDWIRQCLDWSREDKKIAPLKSLQGMIWKQGYESGNFKGHLYPDVAPVLRAWKNSGLSLFVFSSGSVAAQKLLFKYSEAGDLSALFSGHFDTQVGSKQSDSAYTRIAESIDKPPHQILFLSDVVQELDAARVAGLETLQLIRDQAVPSKDHRHATSFKEISLDQAG